MTDPRDPRPPDRVRDTTVVEDDPWYQEPWIIAGIALFVLLLLVLAWLLTRDDGDEIVLAPSPSPTPVVEVTPTVTSTPIATPTPTPTPTPVAEPTPTPVPTPVETLSVPPDEAITEPAPEPVQLSGSGAETTDAFEHTGGLAIIRFAHDGQGLTIAVVEDGGDTVESFTATEGADQGSRAFGLDEGTYRLEVEADGEWDAVFEQPRFVEGADLPTTYEGNGDTATDPFQIPDATVRIEFEHEAADPLEVRILEAETGEVAEELTARSGEAAEVDLPGGLYVLDVRAADVWRAVLS